MPVYTAEPSGAERAAAAVLIEQAAGGVTAADVLDGLPDGVRRRRSPRPRTPGPGERIPA